MRRIGLYDLSAGKFFFDPAYRLLIVRPLEAIARASAWFDRKGIDALVDQAGRAPAALGAPLRGLQSGLVPFYAMAVLFGLLVLLGVMLI